MQNYSLVQKNSHEIDHDHVVGLDRLGVVIDGEVTLRWYVREKLSYKAPGFPSQLRCGGRHSPSFFTGDFNCLSLNSRVNQHEQSDVGEHLVFALMDHIQNRKQWEHDR
jgi:hypothetical protein